ncbi:MAG: hypothetical protein OEM32_10125, partial [Acidimicrobiia bacterium]|nr:hypothetical protein [Acidimicrobiia bacterium]
MPGDESDGDRCAFSQISTKSAASASQHETWRFTLAEIRVAAVQLPSLEGMDLDGACQVVADATAGLSGSDLVLLPEMWTPGYFDFDRYHASAESASKVRTFLSDRARELGAHLHGGSFVEQRGDEFYNTSLLFDP